MDDQVHAGDHGPVVGPRGPAVLLKERQNHSSRNNNTFKVAAPLPRSARHAVTLASLIGDEDEEEVEMDEMELAQAREAYSYSRAIMAHMAGQSGSTPPPAPSSGKGLGGSSAQLWSPSLSTTTFSNPSTSSLSSPSRPRSSSARNSFSSLTASSYDQDRSSWGTRPPSFGHSLKKNDTLASLSSMRTESASEETRPNARHNTSSLPSAAAPAVQSWSRLTLPQTVLTEATTTTSKPYGRHHKRSTTLPPAFVSQIDASASVSGQKHLSLSGNDHQAPLIRSPSPIMTGPADALESGPYHWADTDSDLPISADAMRRKKKLAQSRSSSWQPDWPSISRNATIRSAKPRNGVEVRSQTDARPELGAGSFPRPRALILNDADVVEPAMRSAPLDDGDRRMIEGLRLYEDESDNEVTSGRASGESSLHARRQSLGGRRKSVDFAVKAMGRWAKRKNSTGAFEMQQEPIRAWDRARRPKSHSLSGVMMNPMLGIAATSTPPPRLKSSLKEEDTGELVTPFPFRTSSASGSPSWSPRQLSVSSVHRISRPMSSMPQLYYPDSPNADAQPLEELNRFSSRLTRIESLNALSGAFRKLSTTGEKKGEGEVSDTVQAPGSTHKRLFKAMRDHPLIKRLDSGIAGAVAPVPSEQRSPDRQVAKNFEYLTPVKASDDGRESVTPTQISASVAYRSSTQTGGVGGSTPLQPSTPDIDRKNGATSAGPLALLVEEPARSGSPQASRTKHGERRSRSATQPDLSIGSLKGMFAKKSYAALVNAFNSTGPASMRHVPTVTASGSETPHGGGDGLPYMTAPMQSAAGSGPSGGMGGGGGGGGGNYGWGGLGGGMPGGDGGNGGRPPGGGGGTIHTGRSSPPIQSIFRRLELVGRGAYGAVYRGLHVSSGLHVALKVVNLDTPEDDVSDIQKEVSLLSQLRETTTKNVVKYWGCWLKGSELWIVMDFAEGGSVRTLMKAGPIAEKYAVVIVRESLVALSYLHKSGIIHRDIKAANILLRTTGKVLLCDFGVAASLVSSSVHSKRSTFVGTPYWMAPEVITQGKTYDQTADIWSLGITVYEMVTGNPPLSDQEQMRAIMLIPKSKPPRLPAEGDFSPLLREFVSLCLNEEPKERPSADELAKSKWIKSSSKVPHSMLRDLIQTYAAWTKSGGMRMSLIGAEANELNDVNNRESFAFDGIDGEEGWEFNTDNHSVEWPNREHIPSSAPLRDHPLLRLFHDGGAEDVSSGSGPSQVQHQQQTQPLAARAANNNPAVMPPKGASNNAGPTPTYMGADVRPAPLPPGPIPERPPLAALTSAVDKGSFTGMGATPFRFGRSGAVGASIDEVTAMPTSATASSSNLHQQQHQTQHSNASAQASDENGGGEISMVSSAYGFHQNAGASSANTSVSTAFPSVEGARGKDSPQRQPDSATDSSHQRDGSGLSGVSSSANESQKALQGKDQRHKHTRNDSSSQFSHSRERSEGTSISVGASQASEKRIATKTLPQQQTPIPALRSEGLQQINQRGGIAPSSEAPSVPRLNQTVGSSLQRPAQLGARSRSGSRGRPQDGGMAEAEWNNSSQQPPLPSRSAVVPSASSSLIRSATPGSSTAVQRMQQQVGETAAASPLHQRRQHGGSDPTQMLGRASRELSPKTDQAQVVSNVAASNLSLQHPSGAPLLRTLDLKALMEQEDVFTELEQTVQDLGAWLDVVGSGLAQVAARCT